MARREAEDPPTQPDLLPDPQAELQPSPPTDRMRVTGQVLEGRYRVDKLLAQGAMGRVYLATQLRMDRPVAIKVMHATGDVRFAKRFVREASIASQLTHPNIVSVYDYGETEDGELFMVMEHCAGRPLSVVLHEEAPFSAERVVDISIQLARALKKAHDEGVVHRDLKPANIILQADEDGTDFVKVLDFGLVKLFAPEESGLETPHDEDHLTRPGNMVGTPEYVAPEQALGDDVDGRADIYSLGILMFQMISGKLPFHGKTMIDTLTAHFQKPVPRVHAVAPEVECPMELEAIIQRMLAKPRHERYPSMAEVLLDLKTVWRNLTDESFGSETSFPAISGATLVPIGLRTLGLDPNEAAPPREVAHEPMYLEAADLMLPNATPIPTRLVVSGGQGVVPDPSEWHRPSPVPAAEARAAKKRRATTTWITAALGAVLLAGGAYVGLSRATADRATAPAAQPAGQLARPATQLAAPATQLAAPAGQLAEPATQLAAPAGQLAAPA
ncbi:protein kinase, partial [Myxococcota bacterium]|nr:protein kinase [Myxococcota bacterium]